MCRYFLVILFTALSVSSFAQEDYYNCFAIVAGKNATVDGSVIFAHNEDDGGEQMFNGWVVPRTKDHCKYLWAEMAGLAVADTYLNEYGVALSSDNCPSREDAPSLTDGGILADLRRIVGQTAKTPREAVSIIGNLVETRGYNQPGRTYVVANSEEAWAVSVVYGRHWVAKRVPDNEVMILANCYTIDEVDLSDTENYAGSADLLSYAQKRGWWDPAKEKFSFRKAYARANTLTSDHNTLRYHSALCQLTGRELGTPFEDYYFSVKPSRKLSKTDIMKIMRSHGNVKSDSDMQEHPKGISLCSTTTVISTVMELRSWLPKEIGSIMWLVIGHPCTEVYVPWYLGMSKAPEGFQRYKDAEMAIKNHLTDKDDKRKNFPDINTWKLVSRWEDIQTDYNRLQKKAAARTLKTQGKLLKAQSSFEKSLFGLYDPATLKVISPELLSDKLDQYVSDFYKTYLKD